MTEPLTDPIDDVIVDYPSAVREALDQITDICLTNPDSPAVMRAALALAINLGFAHAHEIAARGAMRLTRERRTLIDERWTR